MKMHDRFVPKKRTNIALIVSAAAFAAAAALMWRFRERLSLDYSDMLIITGLALAMVLMTISGMVKKRQNYMTARFLQERQDEIGTGDYNDTSIFYRDEPKR